MEDQEKNKKTISHYRKDYEFFTGKASEINRNLTLAGVAIIWIFRTTSDHGTALPSELFIPMIWLVIALGLDLLQYIIGGLIWYIFFKYLEIKVGKKELTLETGVEAPNTLPLIIHLLYWSKLVATIIAYFYLLSFLKELLMKG